MAPHIAGIWQMQVGLPLNNSPQCSTTLPVDLVSRVPERPTRVIHRQSINHARDAGYRFVYIDLSIGAPCPHELSPVAGQWH